MLKQYFGFSDGVTSLAPTQLCYCTASTVTDVDRQHGCIPLTLHPQKQTRGRPQLAVPGLDLDLGLLYRKTSPEGQTAIKA